jgi:hypothetical protein
VQSWVPESGLVQTQKGVNMPGNAMKIIAEIRYCIGLQGYREREVGPLASSLAREGSWTHGRINQGNLGPSSSVA